MAPSFELADIIVLSIYKKCTHLHNSRSKGLPNVVRVIEPVLVNLWSGEGGKFRVDPTPWNLIFHENPAELSWSTTMVHTIFSRMPKTRTKYKNGFVVKPMPKLVYPENLVQFGQRGTETCLFELVVLKLETHQFSFSECFFVYTRTAFT